MRWLRTCQEVHGAGAATTGPTNLMAGVTCRDTQDLFRYLTERVAPLDGVRELKTAPVISTVKRLGTALY